MFYFKENQEGMIGLPKSNVEYFCKDYKNINHNVNNGYITFIIGNKYFNNIYIGNLCDLFSVSHQFTFGNKFIDLFPYIEFNTQKKYYHYIMVRIKIILVIK